MDEFDKEIFKNLVEQDYAYCIPDVCSKCKDFIDESDETQNIFRCEYIGLNFHNMDSFRDMYVPEECDCRMEHIILSGKTTFKKTPKEVLDELDEETIIRMETEGYGEE